MSENTLEGLDHQLELFIENIRQVCQIENKTFILNLISFFFHLFQIGIIVSDFQEQGQPVLNQKIQTLISDLQKIDKQRSKVEVRKFITGCQ
jgi:mediator of RNA polymerase II transcription subunit 10